MYEISDGNGGVATATVNITVNPVNDAPVAVDDSATVNEDSTVLIDVLANDSDIDGDTLSITGYTQGAKGAVAQEGDSLRYTPNANFNGSDSFMYEISDGNGGVAIATVNITVNPVNPISLSTDIYVPANEGSIKIINFDIITEGNYNLETSFYLQGCDTVIELYDNSNNMLAQNDDYSDLYGKIMNFSLSPGSYYVKIYEFNMGNGDPLYCHFEIIKN